jgi:protein-S-isoprenylcysteine O-methyltransferase Ste14
MMFKNEYSPSYGQKSLFCTCVVLALVAAFVRTFLGGSASWVNGHPTDGFSARSAIMALCLVIYVIRLHAAVWIFSRRTWTWLETEIISIVMVVALYGMVRFTAINLHPLGWLEGAGVLVYLIGSFLNTKSEYDRHVWKKREEHKGLLYTEGLFSYSMHINYLGDLILFSGLAMITGKSIMLIIPFIMSVNFIFYLIPMLDRYLMRKYGSQFLDYARKTKRLIPWVL